MIHWCRKSPLFFPLLFFLLVGAWTLGQYPLTDGDISHWTAVAYDISKTGSPLTSIHDQAHGPLLATFGGLYYRIFPSFFSLNLFNLQCGLYGLWLMSFLFSTVFQKPHLRFLAVSMAASSLVWIYLSRTPMYDWPAAIGFFGFTVFWLYHHHTGKQRWMALALAHLGIASLSRFSIALGLGCFFIGFATLIATLPKTGGKTIGKTLLTAFSQMVLHGRLAVVAVILFNLPWLIGQTLTHGKEFLDIFLYDNIGRYIREPGNAPVYRDYYGFVLYALIAVFPYTFYLLATVFQKNLFLRLYKDKNQLFLLAMFLPCLVIFSFSGHVKLGRYIAYVFPGLLAWIAYNLEIDLPNVDFRRRCLRMIGVTAGMFTAVYALLIFQFPTEVSQSMAFVLAVIGLTLGLLGIQFYALKYRWETLFNSPLMLGLSAIPYLIFFSVLSLEYQHAPFLTHVRDLIVGSLGN